MYYSCGRGDAGHQLRVASSVSATGPFEDIGVVLTQDLPFAIDPSPYRDPSGAWWLFYASDLVAGERPGTVIVVQRLHDMTRLEGERTVVLRASADWQIYQRDREIYGGTHDWHTLEGPAVVDDGSGGIILLYSGGNWQTPGYGVAVATAPGPEGPWREDPDAQPVLTQREHRADRAGALQRPRRRERRAPPLPPCVGSHLAPTSAAPPSPARRRRCGHRGGPRAPGPS